MPEGDTVWHTAATLRRHLAGRTLTRCDIRVPRFAAVDLTGEVVDEVISRGKHLFIRTGTASIHSHLQMDGSWRVGNRPVRVDHRARIILEANQQEQAIRVVGVDLGLLEVIDRHNDGAVVAHLGPDLLADDWDPQRAAANLIVAPDRPIAEALLDQRVLAGIGNVYCNELCFVSGVLPTAPVSAVADPRRLVTAPETCCGSTASAGIGAPLAIPGPAGDCGSTGGPGRVAAAAARSSPTTLPTSGCGIGARPASAEPGDQSQHLVAAVGSEELGNDLRPVERARGRPDDRLGQILPATRPGMSAIVDLVGDHLGAGRT